MSTFEHKNWSTISVRDIPDCNSKGIYLKHKTTGLEVFHLLNDDCENLFAFAFRTPSESSNGVAHIIEHSVLCGSEKFPLKDPFIRLINQSVKTFLNAMTFPDKTVYPGSSPEKADYFNLMSVYGDAVFFPTLSHQTFDQEAHHLEIDKDGKYSIQGVVYNEMKGNYSSFDSVVSDYCSSSLFPNTSYEFDSGGDPLEIPNLTYEMFKAFHKKYYRPENCLVFLYGNIPTEEQLDFIEKEFLSRINSENTVCDDNVHNTASLENILQRETVKPFEKPIFCEKIGPASESKTEKSTVIENWLLCQSSDLKSSMECLFISEVLFGHDGSPIIKALLDSGLGEDISSDSGLSSEMSSSIMSIGLRGVEACNVKKVESLIFKTLNDLVCNGIKKEDIESSLMSVNFSNREVKRASGPFSLILMRRALHSWNYGREPADSLLVKQTFAEIEKKVLSDKNYVAELIKSYLIDNKHRSLVSVKPDSAYTEKRNRIEQDIINSLKKQKSEEQLKKENELLREYQLKTESESAIKSLPYIKPKDLSCKVDKIEIKKDKIPVKDGDIPLFISEEATNSIVYLNVSFCADTLPASLYPYVPLFSTALTNCGWGNKSWAETAALCALETGGFSANTTTSSVAQKSECTDKNDVFYQGRDLISIRVKCLVEKTDAALNLISDCILQTSFNDTKRLQDLTTEYRNDFKESLIPYGHEFANLRSGCYFNKSKAVDEIWTGLTQFFALSKFTDMEELKNIFKNILQTIKDGGCILHITADSESLKTVIPKLQNFAKKTQLKALTPPLKVADQDFFNLLNLPAENSKEKEDTEIFILPTEVGFSSCTIKGFPWTDVQSVAANVLSHWMSTNILWEQLRTIGGAYGAFSLNDSIENTFTFSSYRDPTPYVSLKTFIECMKKLLQNPIDDETLEKCIVGCYSKEIQPRSPKNRGNTGFLRSIYAISNEDREKRLKQLFQIKIQDIENVLKVLLQNAMTAKNVCITSKKDGLKGKITYIPI